MKKNKSLFIGIAAVLLLLVGVACSKDSELNLVSGEKENAITRVVIRDSLTVTVDTVGTLDEEIGTRTSIQKLIVSGPIDATDVRTIRSLPNLLALDLKEAKICGGDSTYTSNNTRYRLYDNIIGQYMFSGTWLSEIILPNSIKEIDEYAFYNLDGSNENPFSSIVIPEGVEIIRENAFRYCDNLEIVKLSSTMVEVDDYAFCYCSSLTSVDLGTGVMRLGEEAFSGCSSLRSIEFPESLTTLGYRCFYEAGLQTLELPGNLTYEEYNNNAETFRYCTSLESVILPDGMTATPQGIFYNCSRLSSVQFPENLETIAGYTFYGCSSLQDVSWPESLRSIGSHAFEGNGFISLELSDNIESIGEYAFSDCSSLSNVKLPNGLTYIDNFLFASCSSLRILEIPSSVTRLGTNVFAASGLTSIVLPNSVESIGKECFYNCNSLTSVTLSDQLTSLPEGAFQTCDELVSISLPDSILSLETQCFSSCPKLSNIELPEYLESIGSYCFSNCTSLTEINLPEGLETIEFHAFTKCTGLTTITIPSTVTSVGDRMFEYCENLTSIFWNTNTTVPRLFSPNSNNEYYFYRNPYCLLYLAHADTQVDDDYIRNIIVNGVADEIVLSSSMGNFHVPQEFRATRLVYTRSFTYPTYPGEASGWRSISLPFTVQNITGPEGQTLAPFGADVEGAKPFWLRRLTANGFEDVTTIEAGVPYIIAMPNNEAYDDEYNISGTVTFTAESGAGIVIPATSAENMTQDVGPQFVLNCNYTYHRENTTVWALNETSSDTRHAGSIFVRNERPVMPFEGYVASGLVTGTSSAPLYYSIDASTPTTRAKRPLGPVPSIDDM